MSVQCTTSGDGKELVISVGGRFDFTQVKDFRDSYTGKEQGFQEYVIDLRDADHMDSSALGMLLNMRKFLGDSANIRIANTRPQIKKILTISRFDKKFSID